MTQSHCIKIKHLPAKTTTAQLKALLQEVLPGYEQTYISTVEYNNKCCVGFVTLASAQHVVNALEYIEALRIVVPPQTCVAGIALEKVLFIHKQAAHAPPTPPKPKLPSVSKTIAVQPAKPPQRQLSEEDVLEALEALAYQSVSFMLECSA